MKRSPHCGFLGSGWLRPGSAFAAASLLLLAGACFAADPAAESPEDHRRALGLRAVKVLGDATKDREAEVRALAAETFGALGNPRVAPLLKRALQDPDRYVRIAAAESLARLGDAEGIPALEHLASERAKKTASAAPTAMEQIRAVVQAKARAAAIRALTRLGAKSERVLRRARKAEAGIVRDAAAAALARLGDAEELAAFTGALDDPDEMVRLAAVRSLGDVGTAEALEALAKAAKDSSVQVRTAAVAAIGSAGTAAGLPALKAALKDESPLVRAKAIEGLGRVPLAAVAPLLEDARKTAENAYVQLLAMEGLARLGRPVELGLPQRTLSQPDEDTRLVAVRVLEEVRDESALDLLETALEDKETRVRVRAAAAVVKRLARPAETAAATPAAGREVKP